MHRDDKLVLKILVGSVLVGAWYGLGWFSLLVPVAVVAAGMLALMLVLLFQRTKLRRQERKQQQERGPFHYIG
jgi:uncharacterized membrane protein